MNTLFFTSVTLYLAESVLFWFFFWGLWRVTTFAVATMRFRRKGAGIVYVCPNVDEAFLRRFAWFQIAFLAVWSICFKGVLYTTLKFSEAHYLLAKGQSLGIAIPAEVVILLLILCGMVAAWLKINAYVDGRVRLDAPPERAKVRDQRTST